MTKTKTKTKTPRLYFKILRADGTPPFAGGAPYPLPKGRRPGRWLPKVSPILCVRGYHVCTLAQLEDWLHCGGLGARIFVAEVRGRGEHAEDKSAHEQIRLLYETQWSEINQQRFRADCVEHVHGPTYLGGCSTVTTMRACRAYTADRAAKRRWRLRRLRSYLLGKRGRQP